MCRVPTSWSCLDEPSKPPLTEGTFKIAFLVQDTVTQQPKSGVSARVCRRRDVACADAVTGVQSSDASGYLSFTVPAGFDGYVRFEGESISPSLYFFDPPVRSDLPNLSVSVSSPEAAAGLALLIGATPDANLGNAIATVYDCFGAPAEGVTLSVGSVGAAARSFYIRNGLPSAAASNTDETGYGGVVNAAMGSVTFSASIDELMIGSVTVLVQPGALTVAQIVPNGT